MLGRIWKAIRQRRSILSHRHAKNNGKYAFVTKRQLYSFFLYARKQQAIRSGQMQKTDATEYHR